MSRLAFQKSSIHEESLHIPAVVIMVELPTVYGSLYMLRLDMVLSDQSAFTQLEDLARLNCP